MEIAADDIVLLTDEERRHSITYRLRPHCAGKRCRVIAGVILIVLLIFIGIVVFGTVFGIKNKSAKSNLPKAVAEPTPTSKVQKTTGKPWTYPTQASMKTSKPWTHSTLAATNTSKPWTYPTQALMKTSKPWTYSTLAATNTSKPWTYPTQALMKTSKPWTYSTQASMKTSKPSTYSTLSPTKTSKPWTYPTLASTPGVPVLSTQTPPPIICNTSACRISQEISRQLNITVNPCEDFFSYACGGFFKKHQLRENQSTEDAYSALFHDNMRIIRHVLQNATSVYPKSLSIRKTTQIYNSCVNTAAINNRGIAPLVSLIEKYGGWTVTGNGLNSWTVQEKMGHIQKELNVHSLLFASVETDDEDSTRNILKIGISNLGIWIWKYYSEDTTDPEVLKIQHAYKTYMKTIARLLGGGSDSEKKMMRIYNFERDLAIWWGQDKAFSDDSVQPLEQYYHSRRSLDFSLDKTIADFCSDSTFNLTFILDFLNTAFFHQGITFDSREKVYYGYHSIFRHIASKYQTTSHDIIKDYIMWRAVSHYVWSMPDAFVEAMLEFYKALRGARKNLHQRWSFCIDGMLTPMDMTLGRMYVDAHYDEATKTTVQEMTTLIREAFINNLNSADWMDTETKQAAREKANAIKEDVGYPPYVKNDTKLDEHYSMLTVSDDYFENQIAMNKMLVQKNFGMLRHPVNKDMWPEKNPAVVNAFYYRQKNTIGILQTPFYTKNYPKYLNYGSLATVIGHEITHGFDNNGRLYDKNGNFNDWWSEESEANFKSKSDCLVHQYGNYKVFGKKINGKKTLGENIADNGGLKLAYEAYQSWVKANGRENPLPDLSMSVDQLFFIGFAMTHCAVYKKKAALYEREIDSHSYDKYRVIGSLSNFNKFAKAFNCPIGSEMNPVKKCSVW